MRVLLVDPIITHSYSRDISVKTRAALSPKRNKGDFIGASAMYGYQRCKDNKYKLVRDEYAAGVVQTIFSLKIQGMSAARIAAHLNSTGIQSPHDYRQNRHTKGTTKPKWCATTILRILKDENYTGTLVQGRQRIFSFNIRQIVNNPESEWTKTKNAHEPVVSCEDFEQVQHLLLLDTRIAPGKEIVYPFSGFLICACCGRHMTRKTTRNKGKAYIYYCCPTGKKQGCASAGRIKEEKLFGDTLFTMRKYIQQIVHLDSDSHLEQAKQQLYNQQQLQVKALEKSLADNVWLKSQLPRALSKEQISPDEYARYTRFYDNETHRLMMELEYINTDIKSVPQKIASYYKWIQSCKQYQGLDRLDRATMVHMIKSITIDKRGRCLIRFYYQEAFGALLDELCDEVKEG